jgi:hemerythrin superfamily protein
MTTVRKHSAATKTDDTGAIAMLTADHAKVKTLFKKFNDLKEDGSADDKSTLVEQICSELKIHTTIEEEIFYPAVRKAIGQESLVDEALVEHAGAKELIVQLEEMSADDELYDAKVAVLGEQIQHHVKEEEGEMFPKAKRAKVDNEALGREMVERKSELLAELGLDKPKGPRTAKGRTSASKATAAR